MDYLSPLAEALWEPFLAEGHWQKIPPTRPGKYVTRSPFRTEYEVMELEEVYVIEHLKPTPVGQEPSGRFLMVFKGTETPATDWTAVWWSEPLPY